MNKKLLIVVLVVVVIVLLIAKNMATNGETATTKFSDVNKTETSKFQSSAMHDISTVDNSSDELRAVLAEMSKMQNEVSRLRAQVSEYESSKPSAEVEDDVNDLKRSLIRKNNELDTLKKQIEDIQENQSKANKVSSENTDTSSVNTELGINRNLPKGMSDNTIPILSRPNSNNSSRKTTTASNKKQTHNQSNSNSEGNTKQPLNLTTIPTQPATDSNAIIWYDSDDAKVVVDKKGVEVKSYPFSSEDISGVNIASKDTSDGLEGGKTDDKKDKSSIKEITSHEIYTIPNNSTLWDAVSLGSMIGRVPSGGTLKNPYGFKVLLSDDNMASNGIYIPNLKDMVISGYLEGDMLMECVRGTIDSITYTFNDGRIASVSSGMGGGAGGSSGGSEGSGGTLGHISDQWGNECIPGTYISTIEKYLMYVGGASAISSVGELLSDAGTTTSTDGTTVTSTLTSSTSGSTVLGAALEGAADSASDFIEDQLDDAFSAVIIEAGEPLVIHADTQWNIDYDTNGRQVINRSNVEEFLN